MVIDTNNVGPAQPGKPRNNGVEPGGQAAVDNSVDTNGNNNVASQSTSDTVELSSAAQDLNNIREALQSLPDIDQARVDEVSQQIAENNYRVDAEQIAAKILADDQNFLL